MTQENYITITASVTGSLLVAAASYGALVNRVSNLEREAAEMKENSDKKVEELSKKIGECVTQKYFDAVIDPIKDGFKELRADVKRILTCVTKNNRRSGEARDDY